MNLKHLLKFIGVLLLVFVSSSSVMKSPPATTYEVKIEITNIRNSTGTMQLQLYRSQDAFAKESPFKTYRFSKKDVKGHTLRYTISNLVKGNWGVALLDDENSNKKMDYGMVMPKEGFGFSDYYHTGWSKPTFYKFKFYLKADKSVKMKVRYL